MVKRYKPEIKREWFPYEDEPCTEAVMVQSKYGEYVKLSTYKDETARLNARIKRLERQLQATISVILLMEEAIAESIVQDYLDGIVD